MLSLEWIKQCVQNERYRYSRHGDRERQNDDLDLFEVEQALLSGVILENYPIQDEARVVWWLVLQTMGNPFTSFVVRWGKRW